ncbi:folylpolyglutamate synthase/dihydrofolate synthase family protein [Lactobacillus sp. YT155]|uniref:bifunctional folylpolyglutamate synthase/dihydrofolate synthase n=1 Tax=Lactobacillus sp. YT155 TaxID=3060955 RepID=UPI00265FBBAD|nr:folylpolyglutamate synthase/dihydrofolate synthase family protein [Lactobacillus sp. YT155]MDO1605255.1 folylpolyglutamate synthase/dihydrofolate synthase family protein [Lactobacillus sp. YT155]
MTKVEETIKYIHGLPKFHKTADFANIKEVLSRLNNPQNDYQTIHITGTNGKGSVAHFINQMLINSDYQVGMFTSPYIEEFNERIQINNRFISDEELIHLVEQVKNVAGEISLVEFEFVTILGFLYFSLHQVDVAVIEVGIGGYRDKTNVVDADIAVINNIGLDHQALIGPTLEDIAVEKSGIIKRNSVAILGDIEAELWSIFEEKAQVESAKLLKYGSDFHASKIVDENFKFQSNELSINDLMLATAGDFQIKNATVAIEAFIEYQKLRQQEIDVQIIRQSISQVQMLTRLQVIRNHPRIVLDGAHNVHAAKELVRTFQKQDVKILVAIMKDKNFQAVLKELSKISSDITLTTFEENRSLSQDDIVQSQLEYPFINDWHQFITDFVREDSDETLLVTGSIHFVSLVRQDFT